MDADQLKESTLDPKNQRLQQVTIEDAIEADYIVTGLMGKDSTLRKELIETGDIIIK